MNAEPADPVLTSLFPHRYWSISSKKGYCELHNLLLKLESHRSIIAGTAILSKQEPLSVTKTLPGHPDADSVKGRIVTLEFEKFFLVVTYVVNAGQDLKVQTLFFHMSIG